MSASPEFCEHVADLLAGFGPVSVRRMFGGAGLFRDGLMFALIVDDTLYFKVDDTTRPGYEAQGMGPFTYRRKGESAALGYYQAPEAAMEDPDPLCDLARDAFAVALRAQAEKKTKKERRPAPTIPPPASRAGRGG